MSDIYNQIDKYIDNYRGMPAQSWITTTYTFIQSIVIGVCYFISLYFINTLNITISTTGILLSCYGAGTITGGYLSGRLSDLIGYQLISRISLVIEIICLILLSQFTSVNTLMIALFFLGFSIYSFKTSNDICLLKQCHIDPNLRVRAMNISRAAMNLGLGISGLFIGIFTDYDFSRIFYFFSILLTITLLIHLCSNHSYQESNSSNHIDHATHPAHFTQFNIHIISLTMFCLFNVGLMIAQLGTTYPIYVKDLFPSLGMKAVSILYLVDTILIAFAQVPLTTIINQFDKIILLGFGAILMGIGMLILSFSIYFWIAIISCIAWTTGEMIFMPTAQILCYENGREHQKGHSMGLFQATYASSAVLGPTLGGYVYHHMSGNAVWYTCFTLGIICFSVCCFHLKERKGKEIRYNRDAFA